MNFDLVRRDSSEDTDSDGSIDYNDFENSDLDEESKHEMVDSNGKTLVSHNVFTEQSSDKKEVGSNVDSPKDKSNVKYLL